MVMNLIFLVMALLGAILSFGPSILDSILAGVSGINFVSGTDAIVYGVLITVLVALSAFLLPLVKGEMETVRKLRVFAWCVIGLVLAAYVVLVCSIWADSWLVAYRAWTTASANGLKIACYIGWLFMVCSGGWLARVIYERFNNAPKAAHKPTSGK